MIYMTFAVYNSAIAAIAVSIRLDSIAEFFCGIDVGRKATKVTNQPSDETRTFNGLSPSMANHGCRIEQTQHVARNCTR